MSMLSSALRVLTFNETTRTGGENAYYNKRALPLIKKAFVVAHDALSESPQKVGDYFYQALNGANGKPFINRVPAASFEGIGDLTDEDKDQIAQFDQLVDKADEAKKQWAEEHGYTENVPY